MDPVLPLLCLVLGSALPTGLLFLMVRRAMRQLAVASAYAEVSRRHGLAVDTRGVSLHGHLDDRRVWIGEVMVGHGRERQLVVWAVLDFERPLGLGLLLRRRGLSQRLFRSRRTPEIQLGDPDFERLIEVRGDDVGRIRALLGDEVRDAVRALVEAWSDVVITDQNVRVHLRRPLSSGERLHRFLEQIRDVAGVVEQARKGVEAPQRLATVSQDWEGLAQANGLSLEPWLPAMAGSIDGGRRMVVAAQRDADGYRGDLRLYFAPHEDRGLRVRPQVEPDGYWSVGQDIQVGDPQFDASFVIKGWDPDRVRELLRPEVRADLLDLAAHGRLELDDRCLRVVGLPLQAEDLGPVMARAVRLADGLGW